LPFLNGNAEVNVNGMNSEHDVLLSCR
jgi:hypothetical protein